MHVKASIAQEKVSETKFLKQQIPNHSLFQKQVSERFSNFEKKIQNCIC